MPCSHLCARRGAFRIRRLLFQKSTMRTTDAFLLFGVFGFLFCVAICGSSCLSPPPPENEDGIDPCAIDSLLGDEEEPSVAEDGKTDKYLPDDKDNKTSEEITGKIRTLLNEASIAEVEIDELLGKSWEDIGKQDVSIAEEDMPEIDAPVQGKKEEPSIAEEDMPEIDAPVQGEKEEPSIAEGIDDKQGASTAKGEELRMIRRHVSAVRRSSIMGLIEEPLIDAMSQHYEDSQISPDVREELPRAPLGKGWSTEVNFDADELREDFGDSDDGVEEPTADCLEAMEAIDASDKGVAPVKNDLDPELLIVPGMCPTPAPSVVQVGEADHVADASHSEAELARHQRMIVLGMDKDDAGAETDEDDEERVADFCMAYPEPIAPSGCKEVLQGLMEHPPNPIDWMPGDSILQKAKEKALQAKEKKEQKEKEKETAAEKKKEADQKRREAKETKEKEKAAKDLQEREAEQKKREARELKAKENTDKDLEEKGAGVDKRGQKRSVATPQHAGDGQDQERAAKAPRVEVLAGACLHLTATIPLS